MATGSEGNGRRGEQRGKRTRRSEQTETNSRRTERLEPLERPARSPSVCPRVRACAARICLVPLCCAKLYCGQVSWCCSMMRSRVTGREEQVQKGRATGAETTADEVRQHRNKTNVVAQYFELVSRPAPLLPALTLRDDAGRGDGVNLGVALDDGLGGQSQALRNAVAVDQHQVNSGGGGGGSGGG